MQASGRRHQLTNAPRWSRAHHVRDVGVAGSNPATPTKLPQQNQALKNRAGDGFGVGGQIWGQIEKHGGAFAAAVHIIITVIIVVWIILALPVAAFSLAVSTLASIGGGR
jgi:hypothetical protein